MSLPEAQRFLDRVRAFGAVATRYLRAPLSGDAREIFADIENVALPDELMALWQTFDGCAQHEAALGEQWLDGAFVYLSASDAREDYRISEPMWLEDPSFADYMPERFISIATPGDGSRPMPRRRRTAPSTSFFTVSALVSAPTRSHVILKHCMRCSMLAL
jgi:hypothetical protein